MTLKISFVGVSLCLELIKLIIFNVMRFLRLASSFFTLEGYPASRGVSRLSRDG